MNVFWALVRLEVVQEILQKVCKDVLQSMERNEVLGRRFVTFIGVGVVFLSRRVVIVHVVVRNSTALFVGVVIMRL